MKISVIAITAGFLGLVHGIDGSQPTEPPTLVKRGREAKFNKNYLEELAQKSKLQTSTEPPKPWLRTLSDDRVEVVTPTVIAGVTFGAKPPTTTNGLEPWITLDKLGLPKTVKPELKNGLFKKGWPTYGTWFATPTTIVHSNEDLNAHNLEEDEIFTEVKYIDEDPYEHSLNPMIRCTPDRYTKKGIARVDSSEPFCTPHDDIRMILGKTYFITWYSGFFDKDVENVRLILAHVQEAANQKGFKRDLQQSTNLDKRSKQIDLGGKIRNAFFATDWIKNTKGYYPLDLIEEWIGGDNVYQRKVLITIQPDNIPDEEFDIQKNYLVVEFGKGVKIDKSHLNDLKKLEEKNRNIALGIQEVGDEIDYEKYYIMMGLPTCVAIFGLCAYFFVMINKRSLDLSNLRKTYARERTNHRRIPFRKKKTNYSPLPQYNEGSSKRD